jgi:hypothetical protein
VKDKLSGKSRDAELWVSHYLFCHNSCSIMVS